jgi:tripartite-type tricarboxylate transporter receptor subunit TctC
MPLSGRLRALLGAAALLVVAAAGACADDYPAQPVRLVVGYPPGGTTDVIARLTAQALADRTGKPFVVDNRGGASGMIGADVVAKSTPDGYTLLFVPSAHPLLPALFAHMTYDTEHDFAPVVEVATTPYILVVHPSLPINDLGQLIAYAKQKPEALTYASTGMGTAQHLGGELLRRLAGIEILHVPYKGSGSVRADLLAGRIQFMFENITVMLPLVRSGQMRPLAVTSARRTALAPEIPTAAEAGLPGLVLEGWFALLAPARTPPAVIDVLNRQVNAALQDPTYRNRFAELGAVAIGGSPADLAAFMKGEGDKWGAVIREAGIKPE